MFVTCATVLEQTTQKLQTPSARVEAELMLRHLLDCTRAELYTNPDVGLSNEQAERLEGMVLARRAGEPLQYLIGSQAFGHLELSVGPGVLVPRPETELVAERCLERLRSVTEPVVVDVGTGSGAIALYLASNRTDARIWATDVSGEALEWAGRNVADLHMSNVNLVECDLLQGLPPDLHGSCHLVVSNPPYLSKAEHAQAPPDVRVHEPERALVCGDDGLEVSARLVAQAWKWLRPGGALVIETGPGQAERLRVAMEQRFQGVTITKDLTGHPRIVEGSKS